MCFYTFKEKKSVYLLDFKLLYHDFNIYFLTVYLITSVSYATLNKTMLKVKINYCVSLLLLVLQKKNIKFYKLCFISVYEKLIFNETLIGLLDLQIL